MIGPVSGAPAAPARANKREAIIAAAAELFSERSFTATGVGDIAAAVGITGGAVYRHFDSKHDVLRTVVQRAVEQVVGRVDEIVEESASVGERLDALVANLVNAVIENRALTAVMWHEVRHLDGDMREFIDRAHRLHVAEWTHALAVVRPELTDAERTTLVESVWGLIMAGVEYPGGLDDSRLARLLHRAAMAVLLGNDDGGRA